ncbi:MAG TPA: hypothetical protein VJR23_16995 [Candidatus Acidoferrales bacterium]|nr:hypothetical protein [Candidatus Acidoferrales bacterium]
MEKANTLVSRESTAVASAVLQEPASFKPKTTGVLVVITAKQGVTREQVMKVMPAEIRATVRLYLEGAIRQWYSRGDGRGVVFILDSNDEAEARAVIDRLPLSAENLTDHEFIPIGPLMPLGALMGGAAQK